MVIPILNSLPKYEIGDWVIVNETNLIALYTGKIGQIVEQIQPLRQYKGWEYSVAFYRVGEETHEQFFWESELDFAQDWDKELEEENKELCCDSPSITALDTKKETTEKKEESEKKSDPVIWV